MLSAQVGLKGYTIGEKYTGDSIVMGSLGDMPGNFIIGTLQDSTVFTIVFKPVDESLKPMLITQDDVNTLIRGLEIKFDIDKEDKSLGAGCFLYPWRD